MTTNPTEHKEIPIYSNRMDRGKYQDPTEANIYQVKFKAEPTEPGVNLEFPKQQTQEDLMTSEKFEGLKAQKRVLIVLVILIIIVFIYLIILTSLMSIYYSAITNQLKQADSSDSSEKLMMESQGFFTPVEIKEMLNQVNSAFVRYPQKDNSVYEVYPLKDRPIFVQYPQKDNFDYELYPENGTCCGHCPKGWNKIGNSCYFFSREIATWNTAVKECIYSKGGVLLILRDPKEMECVNIFAQRGSMYWIGLRRVEHSKIWWWLDWTLPTFSNWDRGEPNNAYKEENCVATMNGYWKDLDCEVHQQYICKITLTC